MKQIKILTEEERLNQELQQSYNSSELMTNYPLTRKPTYTFSIGDKVSCGALKDVTIIGYNEDKTIYETQYKSRKDETEQIHSRIAYWWEIRPLLDIENLPERITVPGIAKINYLNATIESLLHYYYFFGIDLNPNYQRDFVWDKHDQEYLLDSVFNDGVDIGKFVLVSTENRNTEESEQFLYEILDGKQRLTTLLDFYENRISYKGVYYNDLHPLDKNYFCNKTISIGKVSDLTYEQTLQLFLAVNRGGRIMDEKHLDEVQQLLDEQRNKKEDFMDSMER